MEIKIQENRLNDIINKQFDSMFDVNNISWTMIEDDYGNETDDAAVFYLGDYGDDEVLLDNMFGDRWEKPFKIWFDKHFDIDIKTIE